MTDIFIYTGLGVLLLGSLVGLAAAIKGFITNRNISPDDTGPCNPSRPSLKPHMPQKLLRAWYVLMIVGFIIVGIGISMGLN